MGVVYRLKNGFSIEKQGVYDGFQMQYRYFLYNASGKLTFSYGTLEKAREAALKMSGESGEYIFSQFDTEEEADKWISRNRHHHLYEKKFNSISRKWVVKWQYNDAELENYEDWHPARPIEL